MGIRGLIRRIQGRFPTKLPKGSSDFDKFADSIIKTYNIPDMHSYRQAIATMILHLDPLTDRKPKKYFALSIMKAMANEVAYSKIQEFKKLAEEKAKKEKEELEATASLAAHEQAG